MKEKEESRLVTWARHELELIPKDEDGVQDYINSQILDILNVFCEQGHSGTSAPYMISILTRLMGWKPITPLTGDSDEWEKVDEHTYQNKRCSAVFKNSEDGQAYYIEGKVFSDNGGVTWFTNRKSRVPVDFPWTCPSEPERVYIEYIDDVPEGEYSDRWRNITHRAKRIQELRDKYYATHSQE